jgi:hypothetical protein
MVKQRGGRLGINMSAVRGDYSGYHTAKLAGVCKNAYGNTLPLSQGTIHPGGAMAGPNMHVHPGSTGLQTGGTKRSKRKTRKSLKRRTAGKKRVRNSKRVRRN